MVKPSANNEASSSLFDLSYPLDHLDGIAEPFLPFRGYDHLHVSAINRMRHEGQEMPLQLGAGRSAQHVAQVRIMALESG